jgi:hypothetical protein
MRYHRTRWITATRMTRSSCTPKPTTVETKCGRSRNTPTGCSCSPTASDTATTSNSHTSHIRPSRHTPTTRNWPSSPPTRPRSQPCGAEPSETAASSACATRAQTVIDLIRSDKTGADRHRRRRGCEAMPHRAAASGQG